MANEDRSSIFVRGFLHLVGALIFACTAARLRCIGHPPPLPRLRLRRYVYAVSQVSSRLITFALNLAVARLLTPEAYGVRWRAGCWACVLLVRLARLTLGAANLQLAAVQFHLINTSILLLSREGFRRGCIRDQVRWRARQCVSVSLSALLSSNPKHLRAALLPGRQEQI